MISSTEENYLKAIFKLSEHSTKSVSTNAIAQVMDTSAASVTDMLKRLTEKGYTHYERYKGVRLSDEGRQVATNLLRKHRLWEVFMVDKLGFSWDEVHPVAEQLEHIRSKELVNRLDEFLGFPKFDPHGDPIPDKEGKFTYRPQVLLNTLQEGEHAVVVGVNEHSTSFLQYLEQLQLVLGAHLQVIGRQEYDGSMQLLVHDKMLFITQKVAQNLFVKLETV